MDVLIYKADVVLPGQTQATNEDVVIGIYDDGKNVFSSQLISLYKLFAHYNESVPLKLSIRGNSPVIISTGGKVVDVTKIYYQIAGIIDKNGPETVVNKFRPALYVQMTKMMGGEEASAKFLVDAVINDYTSKLTLANIDNFPVSDIDQNFVSIILDELHTREVSKSTTNLFQKTCTDKLSLALPSRALLASEDIDYYALVPKRANICNPYTIPAMYTTDYKMPGSGVPSSMYPLVEGKASNNTLPIQDNEKEMYEALVKWMQGNIAEEYGKSALEADDKNIVLDLNSQGYLNTLLCAIYSWHWSHNPNVPFYDPENPDEDDDDAETSSKYSYRMKPGEEYTMRMNAYYPLQDFVRDASVALGYKVYAEAVIKLCRWGDRKPSALYFEGYPKIFDLGTNRTRSYLGNISDYKQAIDANGCNLVAKRIIFDNTRIVATDYTVEHGYKYNTFPTGVGIVFAQIYVNKNDPSRKIQLESYYSMLDVVVLLMMNEKGIPTGFKPKGFSVDSEGNVHAPELLDDSISLDELISKYNAEKNSLLSDPFYKNSVLRNLALDMKCESTSGNSMTHLAIISDSIQSDFNNDSKDNEFHSKEELAEKRANWIIQSAETATTMMVAKELLPIIIDVNNECIGQKATKNLEAILNAYRRFIVKHGYKNESDFLESGKNTEVDYNKLCITEEEERKAMQLKDCNAFSGESAKEEEKTMANDVVTPITVNAKAEDQFRRSIIKTIDYSKGIIVRVIHYNNDAIGYCSIIDTVSNGVKNRELILHKPDHFEVCKADKRPVRQETTRFTMVINFMLQDLLTIEDSNARIAIFFDSKECLQYYVGLYKSMLTARRPV